MVIKMKRTIAKLLLLVFCVTMLLSGSGIAEGEKTATPQQEAEEQQEPDDEVSDDMLGPDETMEDQPLDLSVLY